LIFFDGLEELLAVLVDREGLPLLLDGFVRVLSVGNVFSESGFFPFWDFVVEADSSEISGGFAIVGLGRS
jgi:hypothetical protein